MRERLKRIFILFMAAAVLLGAAPSTAFTALADEKETENEDLEIPKVFHKDDDNEGSEIYRGGFRRNEDRGFGFDFYLRYPLS